MQCCEQFASQLQFVISHTMWLQRYIGTSNELSNTWFSTDVTQTAPAPLLNR